MHYANETYSGEGPLPISWTVFAVKPDMRAFFWYFVFWLITQVCIVGGLWILLH